ncbi:speriolin isoform X1 [Podarcis raffonei]|uniref:speriolin isoform X1 n=1 Tax=Podarcis raffonei TaxID=65483 RepID=UPI00232988AC|nr:speriolin isoform X1 [Podarcis raffonei]
MAIFARYDDLKKEIDALVAENDELKHLIQMLKENQELKSILRNQYNETNLIPKFESTRIDSTNPILNNAFQESHSWEQARFAPNTNFRVTVRRRLPSDNTPSTISSPISPGGGTMIRRSPPGPRVSTPLNLTDRAAGLQVVRFAPDTTTANAALYPAHQTLATSSSQSPKGYCYECSSPVHPHHPQTSSSQSPKGYCYECSSPVHPHHPQTSATTSSDPSNTNLEGGTVYPVGVPPLWSLPSSMSPGVDTVVLPPGRPKVARTQTVDITTLQPSSGGSYSPNANQTREIESYWSWPSSMSPGDDTVFLPPGRPKVARTQTVDITTLQPSSGGSYSMNPNQTREIESYWPWPSSMPPGDYSVFPPPGRPKVARTQTVDITTLQPSSGVSFSPNANQTRELESTWSWPSSMSPGDDTVFLPPGRPKVARTQTVDITTLQPSSGGSYSTNPNQTREIESYWSWPSSMSPGDDTVFLPPGRPKVARTQTVDITTLQPSSGVSYSPNANQTRELESYWSLPSSMSPGVDLVVLPPGRPKVARTQTVDITTLQPSSGGSYSPNANQTREIESYWSLPSSMFPGDDTVFLPPGRPKFARTQTVDITTLQPSSGGSYSPNANQTRELESTWSWPSSMSPGDDTVFLPPGRPKFARTQTVDITTLQPSSGGSYSPNANQTRELESTWSWPSSMSPGDDTVFLPPGRPKVARTQTVDITTLQPSSGGSYSTNPNQTREIESYWPWPSSMPPGDYSVFPPPGRPKVARTQTVDITTLQPSSRVSFSPNANQTRELESTWSWPSSMSPGDDTVFLPPGRPKVARTQTVDITTLQPSSGGSYSTNPNQTREIESYWPWPSSMSPGDYSIFPPPGRPKVARTQTVDITTLQPSSGVSFSPNANQTRELESTWSWPSSMSPGDDTVFLPPGRPKVARTQTVDITTLQPSPGVPNSQDTTQNASLNVTRDASQTASPNASQNGPVSVLNLSGPLNSADVAQHWWESRPFTPPSAALNAYVCQAWPAMSMPALQQALALGQAMQQAQILTPRNEKLLGGVKELRHTQAMTQRQAMEREQMQPRAWAQAPVVTQAPRLTQQQAFERAQAQQWVKTWAEMEQTARRQEMERAHWAQAQAQARAQAQVMTQAQAQALAQPIILRSPAPFILQSPLVGREAMPPPFQLPSPEAMPPTHLPANPLQAPQKYPDVKPKERRASTKQETDMKTSSDAKGKETSKQERIVGEIAFQLDRRILSSIFPDRARLYGFTVRNIPEKVAQSGADPFLQLTTEQASTIMERYNNIMDRLKQLGYDPSVHPTLTEHIVNTFGILRDRPDMTGAEAAAYNDIKYLQEVVKNATPPDMFNNCMLLLNCLHQLSQDDGKPLFIW